MARKRRTPARRDSGFYGSFLAEESLAEASSIGEGGEIAEMRRRLMQALNRRPEELRLLVQGANLLVRAAAAEHSLSPGAKGRLAESVAAVLNGLGDQLAQS
jgi:hypothetical protein